MKNDFFSFKCIKFQLIVGRPIKNGRPKRNVRWEGFVEKDCFEPVWKTEGVMDDESRDDERDALTGRLKLREWKMRYGQNCRGGKCRSKPRLSWDNLKLLRYTCPYSSDWINFNFYCIKNIMAAFVFAYWWIVSSGIRVCKFLIISNTSLQYKSRHFSHRKNTYTCKQLISVRHNTRKFNIRTYHNKHSHFKSLHQAATYMKCITHTSVTGELLHYSKSVYL